MLRHPPEILITTPESLFLMLTSRAREMLESVRLAVLDEVHAVAGTKRGAHLALSLERLERSARDDVQRIGLSATQRPLEEIGALRLGRTADRDRRRRPLEAARSRGGRPARRHAGAGRGGGARSGPRSTGAARARSGRSIYPAARSSLSRPHRSTIVFVNNRRLAERARPAAPTSSPERRSLAPTTARSRGSSGSRSRSC